MKRKITVNIKTDTDGICCLPSCPMMDTYGIKHIYVEAECKLFGKLMPRINRKRPLRHRDCKNGHIVIS